jgi:predicted secreted protein
MSNTILTAADNGTVVQAVVGDVVVIKLVGNPTTGYHWKPTVYSAGRYDGVTYEPLEGASPDAIGSPVQCIFRFVVERAGVITLVNARHWQIEATPNDTFTVTVQVSAKSM